MSDAIKEYLLLLKPMLDNKLLDSSLDTLEQLFKDRAQKIKEDIFDTLSTSGKDESEEKRRDAEKKLKNKKKKSDFFDFMKGTVKFAKQVKNVFSQIIDKLTDGLNKAQEYLEKATGYSNKYVTSSSAFVDTSVKEKMLTYGVSSTQAQSMIAAESALGISSSDYWTLTEGQREAFDELMSYYQAGLESIDTDTLEEYNTTMEEYQLQMAKINMTMELAWQKLFVNSEPLQRLADKVLDVMESIVDILSSDTAQFVFDTFLTFLESLINMLSMALRLIGGKGGTSETTINNISNTYNNNQTTQSSYQSSLTSQNLGTDLVIQ